MAGATGFSQEAVNYFRVLCLLINVGTEILRDVFVWTCRPLSVQAHLSQLAVKARWTRLKGQNEMLKCQHDTLYPVSGQTDISRYDISLLFSLIRNSGKNQPASSPVWTSPHSSDLSLEADVARLRNLRNTLHGHAHQATLSDAVFRAKVTELQAIYQRLVGAVSSMTLADLQTRIQQCESAPVDPVREQELQHQLDMWRSADSLQELELTRGEVAKVDEKVTCLDDKVTNLQKDLSAMKTGEMAKVDEKVTCLDDKVTNLQKDLSAMKTGEVTQVDEKVTRLDDNVTNLQKDLSAMKTASALEARTVALVTSVDPDQRHKRRKEQMPRPRRLKSYPDTTDYRATYQAVTDYRPRSSKRPLPSPRERNPPPMMFSTNQRDEFQAPSKTGRPPDYAPVSHYEPPEVPVQKDTYYTQEFTPKMTMPEVRRMDPPRENFRRTSARFEGMTTYREQHKNWVGQKQVAFGELPSFAGSILFPSKKELPTSVTRQAFQGEFAKRPDLIRLDEANIKMEGDHMMHTTHRDTYKNIEGDHRPQKIVAESKLGNQRPRDKFMGDTQSRRDFPGYTGGQPRPPPPARPAPDTIDLKYDNSRSFETEQRKIYRGHDVNKNPKVQTCKQDEEMYHPPHQPMDVETSNKRDYRPIDLSRAYVSKAIIPVNRVQRADVKFDDTTMSKEFFKNWGTPKRERYGDFHENRPYIPPQQRFEGESTTQSCFIPKKYEKTLDFKPENKAVAREGAFDFNTVNKVTYTKPEVKPCRAAIYLMQQELKQQREAERSVRQSQGQPTSLTIAAKS